MNPHPRAWGTTRKWAWSFHLNRSMLEACCNMIKPLCIMLSLRIRMDKKMERSLDSLSAVHEESSSVFSITSFLVKNIMSCYKMPQASPLFSFILLSSDNIFLCIFCAVLAIWFSCFSSVNSYTIMAVNVLPSMRRVLVYSFYFMVALL